MRICMKVRGAGMLSRTKKKYSFWAMMWYELKFSFKYCPVLMLSEIILSTLHGISLVVVTYMTQYFFDTVVDVVNGNTVAIERLSNE